MCTKNAKGSDRLLLNFVTFESFVVKDLVNCNSWFASKFEEPFDKLRVNGQGISRSW
jgi:hypothetical protein